MNKQNSECWLQVSAGQGPAECAWAVLQVAQQIEHEAAACGLTFKVVEVEPGPETATAWSVLLSLSGAADLQPFAASWTGTVQWIARSPFRPEHKRKNWFVSIEALHPPEDSEFQTNDLKWETMRASGPGGQHVNRTESAVRVTHLPTGTHAQAREERSQHRNRKLALARLLEKLREQSTRQMKEKDQQRWLAHHNLKRGDPIRTFRALN